MGCSSSSTASGKAKYHDRPAAPILDGDGVVISGNATSSSARPPPEVRRPDPDFFYSVPLFQRMPKAKLPALSKASEVLAFEEGEAVVSQDDQGDDFFILMSGTAAVKAVAGEEEGEGADKRLLTSLVVGDYFGEIALLASHRKRVATVEATSSIEVVKVPRQTFIELGLQELLAWPKRKAVCGGQPKRKELCKPAAAKTSDVTQMLTKAIKSNRHLNAALDLAGGQVSRIVSGMWKEKVEKGSEIIKEGTRGNFFYVIQSGKFEVTTAKVPAEKPAKGKEKEKDKKGAKKGKDKGVDGVKKLETLDQEGQSFGELALIHMAPRQASVTVKGAGVLWVIDRHTFQDALTESVPQETIDQYVSYIDRVRSLQALYRQEKVALAKELMNKTMKRGEHIVKQGDKGFAMYIMYEGEAVVIKEEKEVKRLSSKYGPALKIVGERALLNGETRAASVRIVSEEAKVLQVDKGIFDTLLGPLQDVLKRDMNGPDDDDNASVASDSALLGSSFNSAPSAATTAVPGDSGAFTDPGTRRIKQLSGGGGNGGGAKAKKKASKQKVSPPNSPPKPDSPVPTRSIKRTDLDKIGLLGCGGFGAVELVAHKTSKESYALKAVSKGYVLACEMKDNILNEKKILLMLSSPFIIKLYETYNSTQFLYFLMEPALGGELHATFHREKLHGKEAHSRFYVAGAMRGIEHMHSKKVIYRDLKPENLLLSSEGRLKVTDMGLAKEVFGKTYTCCGTPEYFAPETIACTGHTRAVDWWSLGVLIWELLSATTPFEDDDMMQSYAMIKKGFQSKIFPSNFSQDAQDLIKALCEIYPPDRLAMQQGGTTNVKKHAWYKGFDWDTHDRMVMEVPYKPQVKSATDIKNFTATEDDRPEHIPYKPDGTNWDADFATVKEPHMQDKE